MRSRHFIISSALMSGMTIAACGGDSSSGQPSSQTSSNGAVSEGESCADVEGVISSAINDFIAAHQSCQTDGECVNAETGIDCFDECTRAVASSAVADFNAKRAAVNTERCKHFTAKGCTFSRPPCDPPGPPKCVNKLCQ